MRKALLLLLAAALFLFAGLGFSETVLFPAGLEALEEEAFAGDAAMRQAFLPDGFRSIGDRAFLDCAGLQTVSVPASVELIGEDAFSGCPEDMLLVTEFDSPAQRYALENRIDCQADTVYRALLIGQSYTGKGEMELNGTENDLAAMWACLTAFDHSSYLVRTERELTADGIRQAILSAFREAKSSDVSLLYYSGHGKYALGTGNQGALLGVDTNSYVTASSLRDTLDQISGRKIVIIDACYSGSMIDRNGTRLLSGKSAFSAEDFTASFISAFSEPSLRARGGLSGDVYFVLAAAASEEQSFEGLLGDDGWIGIFTRYLACACGYDPERQSLGEPEADANRNGALTLDELYRYTAGQMETFLADIETQYGQQYDQHPQVYPADCRWFGVLRR